MPALCGIFIPSFRLTVQQRRRFFYPSGAAFSAPVRLDAPTLSRPGAAPAPSLLLSGVTASQSFPSCFAIPCYVPRLVPAGPLRFVVRCARVRQLRPFLLPLLSVATAAAPRFSSFYNRTNAPCRDVGPIGR